MARCKMFTWLLVGAPLGWLVLLGVLDWMDEMREKRNSRSEAFAWKRCQACQRFVYSERVQCTDEHCNGVLSLVSVRQRYRVEAFVREDARVRGCLISTSHRLDLGAIFLYVEDVTALEWDYFSFIHASLEGWWQHPEDVQDFSDFYEAYHDALELPTTVQPELSGVITLYRQVRLREQALNAKTGDTGEMEDVEK